MISLVNIDPVNPGFINFASLYEKQIKPIS